MNGYIYKIVNDINGKVYIGQTIQPVSTRFRKHINSAYLIDYETGDYKYHYKLSRAIRKYGHSHFHIEVLENCSALELNNKEVEYIRLYDSYNNGYNSTLGGEGNLKHYLKDNDIKEIISLYKSGKASTEIISIYEISMFTLISVLRQNNIDIREKMVGIPLVMYNTNFEPILKFNSFSEAQKFICENEMYTSVDNRNFYRLVKEACKNGNKAYGYRWQLYNDLICDNKIFCTKYDKEKYLAGDEIVLVKDYFICKDALNEIRGFRGKKLNREGTQIKHNKINTVSETCKICGIHISRSTTGYCLSCSQIVAKGKSPKPSKEELKSLLDRNMQIKQIAEIYGRSPSTVSTWIKQYRLR